ncbi:MAG: Alpha/Beta hydrolase protein [Linnemannia gamsii]|nr:MAG: Alpha/Beta hydrolase protein [Linnemannia gamsii]
MEEGEGLSVKVQREMEMELASIQTAGSNHNDVRKKNNRKKNNKEDQFAEGLDAEWLEYVGPAETDADKAEMTSENMAAVLYFHGGGYYTGSKEEHRVLIGPLVRRLGKHVRILIINYRLAPQHPFPAALVDALSSYMWLMDQSVSETFGFDSPPATPSRPTDNFQPRQIVFMGDSAGGGLALSLSLLLRDHASPAIPQPVKIVTWSPWLDLTQALPSFKENALTDCIPYEDFTHLHSDAVDGMFRHMEAPEEAQHHQKGAGGVRQRAQVYCPDTCLRMKYVSPLYETDFRGIPEVLIVCGSAERFANECILLASRLEDQQLTCRIDIHEDMPHIFPLFRFHPSSMEALDRTSAYIRAAVSTSSSSSYTPFDGNIRNGRNRSDSVVIPISPSSSSCSVSSSGSNSPSLSPPPTSRPMKELSRDGSSLVLMDDEAEGFFQHPRQRQQDVNDHETVRRVGSSSSLSSADSSSTSVTQQQQQQGGQEQRHRRIRSAQDAAFDPHSVQHSNNNKKKRTSVNVIDLSGSTVMSFHKQTRFGTPSDRDRALLELETQEEQAALLDDAGGNGLGSSRRRRRRERLTLQDVVSDATLYEWEVLLKQGYVPTRLWPLPSSGGSLSRFSRQRRV